MPNMRGLTRLIQCTYTYYAEVISFKLICLLENYIQTKRYLHMGYGVN